MFAKIQYRIREPKLYILEKKKEFQEIFSIISIISTYNKQNIKHEFPNTINTNISRSNAYTSCALKITFLKNEPSHFFTYNHILFNYSTTQNCLTKLVCKTHYSWYVIQRLTPESTYLQVTTHSRSRKTAILRYKVAKFTII